MIRHVPISVGCYEGTKAQQVPRWFRRNERHFEIEEIVDRWYQAGRDPTAAAAAYFKVRTQDGGIHLLRLDHETLAWCLVEAV